MNIQHYLQSIAKEEPTPAVVSAEVSAPGDDCGCSAVAPTKPERREARDRFRFA